MREALLQEIDRRAKALGLTDITLAKKAGLGRDAIRDIRRGHSINPSHSVIAAVAKALGCTVGDLTREQPRTPIKTENTVVVFELNSGAQGGPGGMGEIELSRDAAIGEFSFPAEGFRQRFGASPTGIFIDAMRGDSQLPTIAPGEPLMIDSRDRSITPPGTMFLCWDGIGMVFKRLEVVHRSDPPTVRLTSDNPRYPPYERLAEEIIIYGRVIGRWARM